ncbi:hypothetical protein MMAD_11210 [Mycolicibacterium madagascariense]|uniref:Uncharacterized protein n=1 Tax=Mycolicibacterium madagascariense TaxID=212765 RepID=A0A7I7XAZ8_9MYCO|nr:hypothetical protein [Mycolicibacterium madagascariense]MCV7011446.1 hypothetical protein [Mycolicibacterium madagascariense]BBZ26826.1 hypothetical protein MMAD_11210 [Mycolicibacterium madagascariense]
MVDTLASSDQDIDPAMARLSPARRWCSFAVWAPGRDGRRFGLVARTGRKLGACGS